jgi:4-amino-4-deoxy-L-arabinose transferase-like glycosyltransferase
MTRNGWISAKQIAHFPLVWLAIVYIFLGAAYALVTPMLEKPDEEAHYGYIVYLRQHHALPPMVPSTNMLLFESKQPPLYYVVTAALTSWLPDVPDPNRLLTLNPYLDFSVPGYRNDNRNVYLHPPDMIPLFLGARLVSLLFGLGTMIVSYYTAAQLFPRNSLAPIATAVFVGFQPSFLYIATALNNDVAIAFLGAVVVALLTHRLQRGNSAYFAVSLGAVLGLDSITKVSGLVFFPLVALALLLIHRGLRPAFFRDLVVIGAVALLVGGWWYARNALLYNDPFTLRAHTQGLSQAASRPFWELFRRDLLDIEHTFWANLARSFISPIWLDEILVWWGRISLALAALSFWLNYRAFRASLSVWVMLLSWPAVFVLLLLTYWARKSSWTFGRFLFPALAPMALLFAWGWQSVFPLRWRRAVVALNAGLMLSVSILNPFVSLYPLYHPSREQQAQQVQHSIGTIYTDPRTGKHIARLIGYNLPRPFATPGEYFPIELCWEPLGQTDVPYAMFVHLLDVSQLDGRGIPAIWGNRETYPGLGNRPTDRWRLDQEFCDTVLTQVSLTAPTPLGASLEVGFVDPKTRDLLQAVDAEGDPVDLAVIGRMPVLSPQGLPTVKQTPLYVLDNAIGLDLVQLASVSRDSMTLTLTWQSLQAVPYDATMFIHLTGTDGSIVAQVDRQPLNGRFPTSSWMPGQIITDSITLPLSAQAQSSPLTLRLGMYTWPSMRRLPVVNASGSAQRDDAIVIDVPR